MIYNMPTIPTSLRLVHLLLSLNSILPPQIQVEASRVPQRTWDTLQSMAQFHGSNSSGYYTEEAIEWIASNFVAVTIEKWHNVDVSSHSEETNIIHDLARIKAIDTSIVTAMYINLICYFPQYVWLRSELDAYPKGNMHINNETVMQSCAGFPKGPVPDWRQHEEQLLWVDWTTNVTKSNSVDGFFFDRIDDTSTRSGGVEGFSKLSKSEQQDFIHGKWNTALNISTSAFVIAGDGERIAGFQDAFIQTCVPGDECLARIQTCKDNNMRCFVHVGGGDQELDGVATFLIGADDNSFILKGSWHGDAIYGDAWKADHSGTTWSCALGKPKGEATKTGNKYARSFESGTKVWLDGSTGKGRIQWGGPCSNSTPV
eukprot:m.217178 g.217178  ORF g.217178 m.217178 type:complete len:372 (+) comp33231_c1_seq4:357-1472(+)